MTINAGEMVTSYRKLAAKSGLSYQSVRSALANIQTTHEVTCKSTHQYTIIKVVKWGDFQSLDDQANTQTNRQVVQKLTTNKNKEKRIKKKDINTIPPKLEEVAAYCRQRHNNVDPQTFMDFYESKGWMVGKNKMKDWKACVRTWEKNRKSDHVIIDPPDYFRTSQQKEYDPEEFKW